MPGLVLVCQLDREGSTERRPEPNAWIPEHLGWERQVIFEEPWGFLGFSAYPGYPLLVFDSSEAQLVLEGRIYGKPRATFERELLDLAEALLSGSPGSRGRLTNWLKDTDGEFLVVARSRNVPKLVVFSDNLGRLPTCWTRAGDHLIISRQPEVFVTKVASMSLDPMGVAQSLLFLYPLGRRTPLRDVSALSPGTLMVVHAYAGDFEVSESPPPNLEEKGSDAGGVPRAAAEIATLLRQATARRMASGGPNVVSLSGGLDSRAVLTSALGAKALSAATLLDYERRVVPDVKVARDLASLLNIPWKLHELRPVTGGDALELLHLKGGANPLHLAFVLQFLRKVNRQHGSPVTLFTGDGGDKVVPDLRPATRLRDLRHLTRYVIDENCIFSPDDVEKMTGVRASELVSDLEATLNAYPERDLQQKYIHFLLFERGRRWLYEGEDRNRALVWATTPFYAPAVFHRCMATPDSFKANYALYRQLLALLSPPAARIKNASWGVPVDSRRASVRLLLRSLYRRSPIAVRSLISRIRTPDNGKIFGPTREAGECLRAMLTSLRGTPACLNSAAAESLMTARGEEGFQLLFSVAALCEWAHCRRSSLEAHLDDALF